MEIQGEEKLNNLEKAKHFFSNQQNLIQCIPNVEEINGNYFKARVKFSFLTVQLNGMIKKHEVNENKVNTIISIEGPGIAATISTILLLEENKIIWKADYSVEGPLANSLKKYIDTEAEKISRQIIECSKSRINSIQS